MGDSRPDFLNHETVPQQLLSERLALGPLAAEEALRYAIELGSAIGRMHARGMVHGAISPDSIAIASEGLLLLEPASPPREAGPYSSPEQVRGEAADARSDVFAFGAVAYELASGRRAFPGTGAELKGSILSQSPAPLLAKSPAAAALEGVVAGCLEKDPARRRQRIQNAVIELKLAGRAGARVEGPAGQRSVRPAAAPAPVVAAPVVAAPVAPIPEKPRVRTLPPRPAVAPYAAQGNNLVYGNGINRRIWLIGAAVLALAASGVAAVLYLNTRPAPTVLKFAVTQPEHTSYPGMPAVSPDGRYLTFSAVGPEGKRMLWLRPLDALHATLIAGTEGASAPFWSPDSQQIAFFAARNLKRVRITSGTPDNICPAEATPGGGAWNKDGTILFSPGLSDGFYRVAASGGKPQLVLKLDESRHERGALWPQFLPDGKHFVFYQQTENAETAGVYVGSIEGGDKGGDTRRLFASQTNAVFSSAGPNSPKDGFLLYINDRNLTALAFNPVKLELTGAPKVLANDIGAVRSLSLAPISVSAGGVLVYQGVGQPTRQMVWLDRGGRQITVAGEPGDYGPPRVSPDGNRAVVAKVGPDRKTAHLWILDRSGGAEQISHGEMHEGSPVWSPDGSKIAYFAQQGDVYDLYTRAAVPDSRADVVVKSASNKYATDWSHDGRYILYGVEGAGTRLDIWGFAVGDRRAAPIVDTVYAEGFGAVSPDGKWLAYQSDQSGRNEVYVQSFDGLTSGTKRRWQVSKGGGLPRWRSDSNELFYITADGRLMSVAIRAAGDEIEPAAPQPLFQTRPVPKSWNLYDVTPDGQLFLLNTPLEWTSSNPITVITNWTENLKE